MERCQRCGDYAQIMVAVRERAMCEDCAIPELQRALHKSDAVVEAAEALMSRLGVWASWLHEVDALRAALDELRKTAPDAGVSKAIESSRIDSLPDAGEGE